jgi:hypothetical protein
MTMTTIKPDEARVIDVLVLAFSTDPGARWTWPEPHQYLAHFRELVKAFGGKAFAPERLLPRRLRRRRALASTGHPAG